MKLKFGISTFLATCVALLSFDSNAYARKIKVGAPMQMGDDRFCFIRNKDLSKCKTFSFLGTMSAEDKAMEIKHWLISENVPVTLEPPDTLHIPDSVTFFSTEIGTNQTWKEMTGKKEKASFLQFHMSRETILTGLDGSGNVATYQNSFGFSTDIGEFTADSLISASDLPSLDVDSLLTTIFNNLFADLPSEFQSNLSLDLVSDTISFVFPENSLAGTGFLEVFMSDTGAIYSTSFAIESVPEPSSTISLLALGTLGAASTFKRKLKPSQSTEKETTKVG
ncbi:MAG: PEP-CTERM sorting domain-containing protein [Microcystis sp.]|uniref:PEP-CTERM sorting domain-containing protein n=1 Tax=Microcystis sp. TaxID=1127 RepID=UPI00391D8663